MKKIYLLLVTTGFLILLVSCSTSKSATQVASINHQTTASKISAKNPDQVALYKNSKEPHAAYRVIGVAKVSRFNMLGFKHQDETLENMLKKLAASMGGDAIMNVSTNNNFIQANVIQFQQILI